MRRLSWALTRFSSRSCASVMAALIASSVISWNTIRRTGIFGFRISRRCQLIDSPSRSGSVASSSSEACFTAAFSAATCFFLSAGTT